MPTTSVVAQPVAANTANSQASTLQSQTETTTANVAPQANLAQTSKEFDVSIPTDLESQAWFVDSGASHHLTTNSLNLQQSSAYVGSEQVHMGNGQGAHIKSISSVTFQSCLQVTTSPHTFIK